MIIIIIVAFSKVSFLGHVAFFKHGWSFVRSFVRSSVYKIYWVLMCLVYFFGVCCLLFGGSVPKDERWISNY